MSDHDARSLGRRLRNELGAPSWLSLTPFLVLDVIWCALVVLSLVAATRALVPATDDRMAHGSSSPSDFEGSPINAEA